MRLNYFKVLAIAATLAVCSTQASAQGETKPAGEDAVDPGKSLFKKKCAQCHSLAEGVNGNGPSLYRVVDKAAAIAPGFKYSRALQRIATEESLKWSEENLIAFLARPSLLVPGTRMAFPGMENKENLAVLVEWIKANSGSPSNKP